MELACKVQIQTINSIELLVVNGDSKDKTLQLLKNYKTLFANKEITQLFQVISANNACINLICEAIQSITLLFMQAVISTDSIEICSTNRAIRLWRASVSFMS